MQQISVAFERDLITDRLYQCYMQLGKAIAGQNPPVPEEMPVALDYFTSALSVRPRDPEAQTEQRLVSLYLAGRQSYESGRWQDAATQLGSVFDARPGYMGSTVLDPLYDALIRYGDQMRDVQDYYLAWEQYRRAASLPVPNRTLAEGRMASVQPFLTPTPTPTDTPTITPPPTATPYIPPTAVPSGTPPPPLATFRNQIVFRSDQRGSAGLLGDEPGRHRTGAIWATQEICRRSTTRCARRKPTRRTAATASTRRKTPARATKSPQIYYPGQGPERRGHDQAVDELCADELRSGVGARRQPHRLRQHGGGQRRHLGDQPGRHGTKWNDTPNNDWEWDKHPSWSPDSRKIVFWTNREGTKQIYVIDADGRNLQARSAGATWDEYDPIWVK